MVIIAFSEKTSKILPRIVCRRFRHCAPIIPVGKNMIMYQFSAPGQITQIDINMHGIRRLRAAGWHFVYVPCDAPAKFENESALSCVDLSKRALRIHAPWLLTPDGLYKHLQK